MKQDNLNIFFLSFLLFLAGSVFAVEDKTAEESTKPDSVSFELFPEGQQYADILKMPEEWKEMALGLMNEFIDETGISEYVKSIGIVGSFAYGCARPPSDPDPSDIDIVIHLKVADISELPSDLRVMLFQGAANREDMLQKDLKSELNIDILIDDSTNLQLDNPDYVYYSLTEDKIYGRPDNKPLFVKIVWYDGKWYQVPRKLWDELVSKYPDYKLNPVLRIGDNGKLQYLHKETGEVLLESE